MRHVGTLPTGGRAAAATVGAPLIVYSDVLIAAAYCELPWSDWVAGDAVQLDGLHELQSACQGSEGDLTIAPDIARVFIGRRM